MMFYDRQTDRLYTEDTAMEGIFSKIKEKRAAKAKKREENAKEAQVRKDKCKEQLKEAVPIIKKWISKAKSNPKWQTLPFGNMNIENGSEYLYFEVFTDVSIVIDAGIGDNFNQDAYDCFNYLYDSIKKEIESKLSEIKVTIYESNEIFIEIREDF